MLTRSGSRNVPSHIYNPYSIQETESETREKMCSGLINHFTTKDEELTLFRQNEQKDYDDENELE